jgi:hypothetical protein
MSPTSTQSLGPVSRIEAVLLGSALAFLIAISAWFLVLRFSISWPLDAVLATAIVGVCGVRAWPERRRPRVPCGGGAEERPEPVRMACSLAEICFSRVVDLQSRTADVRRRTPKPLKTSTPDAHFRGVCLRGNSIQPQSAVTFAYTLARRGVVSSVARGGP